MAITKKEIEKKMLIRKTITAMDKQIQRLEEQKKAYINAGKQAKERDLTAQYQLALSGLRMTIAQQRRVYEMKLNMELTMQIKDMSAMTADFFKGMSELSKDMMKLSKQKGFMSVQEQFAEAMTNVEMQTEQLESFMDDTEATFSSAYSGSAEENGELDKLITNEAAGDNLTEAMIDKELEELKKKMGS